VPLWKSKQKGYEVITSTLGEFDEGLRSSSTSPAILMNMMASKSIVENFYRGFDGMMQPLIGEMKELIKGRRFYCEALRHDVLVIAAFHGFESDLIERCKAGDHPTRCSPYQLDHR